VDGGKFVLDVTIPVGATASVWLPSDNMESDKADAAAKAIAGPNGLNGFAVSSGTYHFECALAH
jgi:hypothetical protein